MWHFDSCDLLPGTFGEKCVLWRRTCGPGDPFPQRQRAWLLSSYLKEGEEQKEVLEAKDDEEKESEFDGEVEERESHSTCA